MNALLQSLQAAFERAHHALPEVVDGADEPVGDGLAQLVKHQLLQLGNTLLGRLEVRRLLAGLQIHVLKLELYHLEARVGIN